MVRTTIDRLGVKTLEQRFRFELETGFELAPRIAQGILDVAHCANIGETALLRELV